MDSLDHPLACYKMDTLNPEWAFDEKVSFLSNMAAKAAKNCPILPIRIPEPPQEIHPEVDEISLPASPSESSRRQENLKFAQGEENPELELEFDGHEEE